MLFVCVLTLLLIKIVLGYAWALCMITLNVCEMILFQLFIVDSITYLYSSWFVDKCHKLTLWNIRKRKSNTHTQTRTKRYSVKQLERWRKESTNERKNLTKWHCAYLLSSSVDLSLILYFGKKAFFAPKKKHTNLNLIALRP